AICPVAATRMTENLMPPQMLDMLKPEYVTPGVVYLASEDAPTGTILTAGAGVFSAAQLVESNGINLGHGADADTVAQYSATVSASAPWPRLMPLLSTSWAAENTPAPAVRIVPVGASSLARYTTPGVTYSGFSMSSICGGIRFSVMRVAATGQIALTLMLSFAPSSFSVFMKPTRPSFAAP